MHQTKKVYAIRLNALKIPYDQLNPETLNGVIEEFVTRDGTDYGEIEVSLDTKISQVLGQLKSGKAVIVFDQGTETCNILKSDDPVLNSLDD